MSRTLPLPSAVLSIGDELILGRTVDTNATWLCARLADAGCPVATVLQVGDAEAAVTAALAALVPRHGLIVCTGGLGPTDDDRTRHALAGLLGRELHHHEPAWRQILRWYERQRPGFAVPSSNRRQALVPRGVRILANDRGTAPGLLVRVPNGPWIACLPGVPHEMKAMAERLFARLPRLIPGLVVPTIGEIFLAGVGESAVQERIPGLLTEADPQVGITVSEAGHLTIRALGRPTAVARRLARMRRLLKPWLLPCAGLAPSVLHRLAAQGRTIACAESCTAGLVAAQFGGVPGASAVLAGGIVAYQNAAKQAVLGVDAGIIAGSGPVSAACAAAMAQGARERFGADLAIATTGYAGPDGGTKADPVGTVYLALAHARGVIGKRVTLSGDRPRIQQRAAAIAVQMVWDHLNG